MPFDRGMAQAVREWRNSWEVWRYCRQRDVISDAEQDDWFERQHADPTIKMYGIGVGAPGIDMKLAGVAGFTDIDHFNRRAEFSLYIRPSLHRRGLGKKALRLLLGHGFSNLGFNVIWGETFAGNPAGAMFESLGMVREGIRREFYWKDGAHVDAILYSITRGEWCKIANPT